MSMPGMVLNNPALGGGGTRTWALSQTLGNELFANGTFAAWTADNPDGWEIVGEAAGNEITQRGSGQTHASGPAGTGLANIYTTGANLLMRQNNLAAAGDICEVGLDVDAIATGSILLAAYDTASLKLLNAVGSYKGLLRFTDAGLGVKRNAACDVTVDNFSVKKITPNTQLTMPSSNMRLELPYTLPASPLDGTQVWLYARLSSFSLGNYWKVELVYTGAQWNITLYRVATFTQTASAAAALNIGATNRIRLNANANLIDLLTSADGGATWTARGAQVNDATYNTAAAANVIWTSDITCTQLIYTHPN